MTRLGKYEILEEIGRGSCAVVYRARITELDRFVALKVIGGALANEAAFVQRFRQEARAAATLHHPNVVTVYDFGDADGTLYLAMALIGEGHTLRDLLAEEGPLSLEQALPLLTQLADALDYLHSQEPPMIHHNVRPTNILLEGKRDELRVFLSDCGLAPPTETPIGITESDSLLSGAEYLAPEQADSRQWGAISPLTDIYALGVIAFEMLTGRAPFDGNIASVLHGHAHEPPPSPLALVPSLSTDLAKALTQALAKPPAERYPSARALVATLARSPARMRDASEALGLFDGMATAFEEQNWEKVVEIGERLVQLAPDLDRPRIWLTRARDELGIAPEAPTPPSLEPPRFGTGDLPPRVILAGRYVILKRIARGGTGATYQAQDQQRQNKTVALREMSTAAVPPAQRKLALESFQRMAEAVCRLEHPNLPQVTDHFQAWGRYYIAMEFIHGQTLTHMLEGRSEPFSERQVLAWAAQLCDVLSYLHSQEPKIIYRGMKPDNVMVESGTDMVKLFSFSIARFFKPGHEKDTFTFGTMGYAAPEQYGTAQSDERTDIYGLGVTLHHLLTLHDPATQLFVFPSVRQVNPQVSQRVAQAIAKAIKRDPEERFQTVLQMKRALLG